MLVKPKLPPEDKDFMGRKKECEEIMHHLSSESTRIVSIFGPPGFGKSQVAIAVGNDLKFQGKTVYHLELRRVQNKKELISKLLCNFNVSPNCRNLEPEDSLSYQFSQVDDHLYFILDNTDRLLEPNVRDEVISLIKEILTTFSNVTFIVTTRESPAFSHLESLGQKLIKVGSLGMFYCQTLVQKLIPGSSDVERKKIAQLCGYMPLAIILMCRSINESKKPLNEAIDDFVRSTNRIVTELDNPEDVYDSRLIGIFGSSFESLSSQDDKEAFLALSVIPGTFDEEFAADVLGTAKSDARKTLNRLCRRSLIDSSSDTYKMHKLLQSFARVKGQNEMNKVFLNAKTRLYNHHISLIGKLNEEFLSGNQSKSKSMSAFTTFYQDKHSIVSSLIAGCSDSVTSYGAFDVLMKAELFLDTLLWSDSAIFDKIYDSAIMEAKERGNKTAHDRLVVSKALSEVTWSRTEVKIMQQLSSILKETQPCISDGDKGKCSCYLGIFELVNGNVQYGVELLESSLSYWNGTIDPLLKVLKVLALQILCLYYESTDNLKRAVKFYKDASEEWETAGDPSLLVVTKIRSEFKRIQEETTPKEVSVFQVKNQPLPMAIYSLITKATKSFVSAEAKESLQANILQLKQEIDVNPSAVSKVGLIHFHRFIVDVLVEMGNYNDAIQFIQEEIVRQETFLNQFSNCDSSEQDREEDIEALAKSYANLAVLQFRKRDYEGSLHSQRRALERTRELFGEEHENTSTADGYHTLGIILRTLEDCNSALHFQQRALDIRKLSDVNSLKIADTYHELGITQCQMGDYFAALRCHETALKIRLEHLGKRHKVTANSYHELGITQWYLENYECAVDSHKEALRIALEVLGEHTATADSYHELGKTYFSLQDYLAALQSHLHAERTRVKILGEQHSDTASSYYELGVTRFKLKQYDSALQSHSRALAIRQKIHGEQHVDIAQSYHQLGRTQYQMGNYSQAFQSHNNALSIRKHLFGDQHLETADSFYELGKTSFRKKDITRALVTHELALAIRKTKLGNMHAVTADSLYQVGLVQWEIKLEEYYKSSFISHQSALDIRLKCFDEYHSKTAKSYSQLGLINYGLHRYPEALDSLQEALRIREKLFGYCHTETANSYFEICKCHLEIGVYDSAFESLQDALQITTELLAKQQIEIAHCSDHDQKVKKLLSQDYR